MPTWSMYARLEQFDNIAGPGKRAKGEVPRWPVLQRHSDLLSKRQLTDLLPQKSEMS